LFRSKRLTEEYEASGQSELFKQLEHHWNASVPAKPHGEVAETLNMAVAAVNVAAHRLRQRYRTVLREIVGDTVESPDEVEDEIRDLMNSFGNRS
ncbi:MAG: sigma-70 family RNA polymerase sigma factor, partial [Planctomycetota bacterium]